MFNLLLVDRALARRAARAHCTLGAVQ